MKTLSAVLVPLLAVCGLAVYVPVDIRDTKQGVKMGVSSFQCDNAKVGLEMDWNGSEVEHTCFLPFKQRLPVLNELEAIEHCNPVPDNYYPYHYCMYQKLEYNETIPTHGDHRPLWAVFGEYRYVPPQRWLHNIEHGSVVMLYHPCADPQLVEALRSLVTGCIRKHVITPYPDLSVQRPLALVAWGCRLEMAHVEPQLVRRFIQQRGLKGPEGFLAKQGQYDLALLRRAQAPPGSDINDSVLCPEQATASTAVLS